MAFTEKYVTVTGGGLHDGSSEANAWTLAEAHSNMSAGDRLNIKAGTYTYSTTLGSWPSSTFADPCSWRGYKTTIGDLDDAQSSQLVDGTDVPLFETTSTSANLQPVSGVSWIFENISFKTTNDISPAISTNGKGLFFRKCKFITTATSSYFQYIYRVGGESNLATFENCYFLQNSSYTPNMTIGARSVFHGCVFDTMNTVQAGATCVFLNCIFKNFSSKGITLGAFGAKTFITGCTFYNVGSHAIEVIDNYGWNTQGSQVLISNNVFHTVAGDACRNYSASDHNLHLSSNLFYSVTGSHLGNQVVDVERDAITASSDPFTDTAGGDFSLTSASGGQGKASPQLFMGFDQSNNQDIGAIQHADPSGGGGAVLHPLRSN